jgi:hypothetical protein
LYGALELVLEEHTIKTVLAMAVVCSMGMAQAIPASASLQAVGSAGPEIGFEIDTAAATPRVRVLPAIVLAEAKSKGSGTKAWVDDPRLKTLPSSPGRTKASVEDSRIMSLATSNAQTAEPLDAKPARKGRSHRRSARRR